ncbi:MAG TPA: multicopper oxidase domain-containing protein [Casimicrobiaceae bacterium]
MNTADWTRRRMLRAGIAALGAATVAKVSLSEALAESGHWYGDESYPLPVPEQTPANLPLLTCAPALVNMGDGKPRRVLAYNGQFPGPTWVARTGDMVTTRLQNGLDDPTITHWHGLVVDFANDGGPLLEIEPGTSYDYSFPIVQRAGLNFYHPHPHMLTGEQVCLGLAGAFIIRDDEEDALGLPSGPYEVPLVIRDASFDNQGNLLYNPTSSGFKGKFPLVNGTLNPMLNVDRGVYRLRVLNGANARMFRLALSNGAPLTIIGNDGGLLPAPVMVTEILLGMAERLDLLVDFRTLGAGQSITLRCLDARWDLVKFVGAGQLGVTYSPPPVLSTILPLSGPSQPTRSFTFDGMSRINGLEYDPNRLDFRVPLGVTERWRFKTGGNAPHPVHVHGAHFQVVSRTGGRGRLYGWEGGWKDTVLLNDRETVDVLIRFNAYRDPYVIHCHQLEHESMGMMANFDVY